MSVIELEMARVAERLAAARRQHKPISHLQELQRGLRLEQLRGECREDWLELARREFCRRHHEENQPATCPDRSQCEAELGQDVRSQH